MPNLEFDEELLKQAEALMDDFNKDVWGPEGAIGQPALCETLKYLSKCLAKLNKKYGDMVFKKGDPFAGFVDVLNAQYAISDIANILDAAGDYKVGDKSREETAYEIAYSIFDLGSRLTGGIGNMNMGSIGTYCSLILGTSAACLGYGKKTIDMHLQQLEDATFIWDHIDDPELWPDSSGDLRAYLKYSGIEEEDIEELLNILDELETQMGTVQSNLEYIKHLEYLESKSAAEELDNFINEVNNWAKTTNRVDEPIVAEDSELSYKSSKISSDTFKSMFSSSTASSPNGHHSPMYIVATPNTLKNEIEFNDDELIKYFKELNESNPNLASRKYEELLENIEKSKDYLSSDEDEKLEDLQDLADKIGEELPISSSKEYDKSTEIQQPRDPLVIDLGNDNVIELTSVENGVHFDLDKNGFAERTAWIGQKDGFLALDRNGNGFIDDGGELFSDQVVMSDGRTSASGFEALKDLDANDDGIISKEDEQFDSLRVWVDENHNGISEANELKSLAEHDITSISLNHTNRDEVDSETGTIITESAEVILKDGSSNEIAEHWFEVKTHDTVEKDENGNNIIADSVESFGNIKNLSDVIRKDTTKTLSYFVKCFKNSEDYAEKRVLIKKILFF